MVAVNLFVANMTQAHERNAHGISAAQSEAVGMAVLGFFEQVCAGTNDSVRLTHLDRVSGTPNVRPSGTDLVVYIVATEASSIIARVAREAGVTPNTTESNTIGGRCAKIGNVTISEIYADSGRNTDLRARIAFHELMHAKLDVGRQQVGNLHNDCGGGIAGSSLSATSPLEPGNIQAMQAALSAVVPQYADSRVFS